MKKLTVSIAIPAYNEEANIGQLLKSLALQSTKTFTLKSILVYSDGSTDKTHAIVKKIEAKNTLVKLKADGKQLGKYARLNQVFHECKTDLLLVLDADIALVGNDFIEKLVANMEKDAKATLLVAHNVLLRPEGFIPKIIHTNFAMWDFIRWSIPQYQHAANYYGSAVMYRGDFVRSINIPKKVADAHLYIYLASAKNNGFRYAREAEVLQFCLTTIKDLIKFTHRSLGKKDIEIEKIFKVTTEDIYAFSIKDKINGLLKTVQTYPFHTPFALLLGFYIGKIMPLQKMNKDVIWEITTSTKKPHSIKA